MPGQFSFNTNLGVSVKSEAVTVLKITRAFKRAYNGPTGKLGSQFDPNLTHWVPVNQFVQLADSVVFTDGEGKQKKFDSSFYDDLFSVKEKKLLCYTLEQQFFLIILTGISANADPH